MSAVRPKQSKRTKVKRTYRQSAVIPLLDGTVVMITSRRRKRWIVPKGLLEPGMTPAESAANEALEEAGLTGTVRPGSLGHFSYRKWGRTYRVEVYVLDVKKMHDEWDEMHFRSRKVFSLSGAAKRVEEPELRRMIERMQGS